MRTRRTTIGTLLLFVLLAGWALLPPAHTGATGHDVSIVNFSFSPSPLTIQVGDSVTWTNNDQFDHTATSDTSAWDSGSLAAQGVYSFTFTAAGTYAYHCEIHTAMQGTIIVEQASATTPVSYIPLVISGPDSPTPTQ